jgi:polysaccharide biosynthesis protein PslH
MKLLFVCHDPPAPATNGGAIDMLGMSQAFHDLGHEVDLLYTVSDISTPVDIERLNKASTRHWSVLRNGGIKAIMTMLPYQISSRNALAKIEFERDYDCIITSDHCSSILLNPSLKSKFRVLRRNNIEEDYALRMAQQIRNPFIKAFFLRECWLFKQWHMRIDFLADQIWYVSTEEMARQNHRQISGNKTQHHLVPSALGAREFCPVIEDSFSHGRILYFGSLTVPVNRQSVDWYVDTIHPFVRARHPKVDLMVAGRANADMKSWTQRHTENKAYRFLPNPEDAEKVYAHGGIFIDPMAHDAGIKLKILEAIRRGYAIVCSPNSLYGSGLVGGQHALVAQTSEDMANAVIRLLSNPKEAAALARAAQNHLREHFDIERDIRRCLALLEQEFREGR